MNQILFVKKQGAYLRKEGNSMAVFHERNRAGLYPLENVDALVLMGSVEISSSLIKYAAQNNIRILWTDQHGILKAMVKEPSAKNIVIRVLQYRSLLDSGKRVAIAKECVKGKILNQMNFIRKIKSPVYSELKIPARNALESLAEAKSIEQIRGVEGGFAAVYFRYFPGLLIRTFGFKGRTRRPPRDPVNALLSFGYTLLFLNIFTLLEAKGLDPYLGYLHDLRYSHPALASDFIEPMRFVIDQTVVDMINREMVTEKNFEKREEGVTMTAETLKLFSEKIRENVHIPLQWADDGKQSVIHRMERNITLLVHYIGDKIETMSWPEWK